MRSTTVAEAVGRDCKEEILSLPLGRSDGGNDGNDSDVPLRLPLRGITTEVAPLNPIVTPTINPR